MDIKLSRRKIIGQLEEVEFQGCDMCKERMYFRSIIEASSKSLKKLDGKPVSGLVHKCQCSPPSHRLAHAFQLCSFASPQIRSSHSIESS